MPANLTPQYRAAEEKYREAKTPGDKLTALEEMLTVIPKHKGTEHLQGDIKSRIAKLRRDKGKKSGARHVDPHKVEREGAAQVVLIGPPNVGKSALLGALTNAKSEVAPYPYSTQRQYTGMMPYEDIQIQLIDTPPLCLQHSPFWILELVKYGDAVALVVDLGEDDPSAQIEEVRLICEESRVTLCGRELDTYNSDNPFPRRCIIVGNKLDIPHAEAKKKELEKFFASEFPIITISAEKKLGLDGFKKMLFEFLELVRVYSKAPHKKMEQTEPDVFRKGCTVLEVAEAIHKDFAEGFKYAKIWGEGKFDGQRVSRDYLVDDGDIIEIHT